MNPMIYMETERGLRRLYPDLSAVSDKIPDEIQDQMLVIEGHLEEAITTTDELATREILERIEASLRDLKITLEESF